jgi:copper chaperone CopZ
MKFQVEGMNCMSCVRNIDEALKDFDEKLSATADLKAKTVSVETIYPAEQIRKLIEEAGYEVKVLD